MKMQQSVDKTQMLLRLGNSSLPHAATVCSNSSSSTIVLSPELLVGQIQPDNANITIAANINGEDKSAGNKTNDYLFLIEFGAGALGGAVSRTA